MLLAKVETRLSITLQRMEESKRLPGLSTRKQRYAQAQDDDVGRTALQARPVSEFTT